ncbi:hypothetical protein ABB02_01523 [Clostridiaceae bacterium JG1575]|nr:hypothetical protein ABB02_01523 [Clostridiaceae bacterium JG1575]
MKFFQRTAPNDLLKPPKEPLRPLKRRGFCATFLCLLCFLSVGLGACRPQGASGPPKRSKDTTPSSVEQGRAKEKERVLLWTKELLEGCPEELIASFDEAVAKSLSKEALEAALKGTVSTLGPRRDGEALAAEFKDGKHWMVYAPYEKASLRMTYVLNDAAKVSGIWLAPASIEEYQGALGKKEVLPAGIKEREVAIGPWALRGYFCSGAKEKALPVVVLLVPGSGPQDANETLGPNHPLKDLAHGLAERGIATLRFDKRTYQPKQSLDPSKMTVQEEYLEDLEAAWAWLLQQKDLQGYYIGYLGHSLGGMLIPALAKAHPKTLGWVSLAGSPRHLLDIIFDQNKALLAQDTTRNPAQKEALLKQLQETIEKGKRVSALDSGTTLTLPNAYLGSLNALKLTENAQALQSPILILRGAADQQVFEADQQAWKAALSKNPKAEFKTYPGLNHLFLPTQGKPIPEDYAVPGTIPSQVLEDLAAFFKKLVP